MNFGQQVVANILTALGTRHTPDFSYPRPNGRMTYDMAVFASDDPDELPAFLVVIDKPLQLSKSDFASVGARPCRVKVHGLKRLLATSRKDALAVANGAYVLHLDDSDLDDEALLTARLATLCHVFVDHMSDSSPEVSVARLMERYYPDETYVARRRSQRRSQAEREYLAERCGRDAAYVECDDMPCMDGEPCPIGLDKTESIVTTTEDDEEDQESARPDDETLSLDEVLL